MKIIRALLFPITPIYYFITWLRNLLYDSGYKKSKSYDFPVICVGNISAGGTGKTPMVEYLIRFLKADKRLATLSRGYGRTTKGFLLAKQNIKAEDIGDEPLQFYNKFKADITVAVHENRQLGIKKLKQIKPELELVILDDAFQHRKVKAGLNILLTTYANPYFNDSVLPTGNLREPRAGAKRANIIVVTKCPENITETQKIDLKAKIKPNKNQFVFFSSIGYSKTIFSSATALDLDTFNNFTLVTGIANAKPLVKFLKTKGLIFNHFEYKDHHYFTKKEIHEIAKNKIILTTEKDYMRLKREVMLKDKLFYIPIICKIEDALVFNSVIRKYINS